MLCGLACYYKVASPFLSSTSPPTKPTKPNTINQEPVSGNDFLPSEVKGGKEKESEFEESGERE